MPKRERRTAEMELTLYGIDSCDGCRKARRWLEQHAREFKYQDLREDGLDIQTLERWSRRLAWEKFLNTRSLTWRKIPEVDRSGVSKDRALALMLEHPTLVKRPVLEHAKFIAVGFSPVDYARIFDRL